MSKHKNFTEDDFWRRYFHMHFPELEEKYPSKAKTRTKQIPALWRKLKSFFEKRHQALCQDCKYNTPRICPHPERPNATECRDFRQKQSNR